METKVELMGRYSNQGWRVDRLSRLTSLQPASAVACAEPRTSGQQQRRLSKGDVALLVKAYRSGSSVKTLAAEIQIHRTTVMNHLERAGELRRPNVRAWTDEQVAQAAGLYQDGASLLTVGKQFNVSANTIQHELMKTGVVIRPRRGR